MGIYEFCAIIPNREQNMKLLGRTLLEPIRNLDADTDRWLRGWTSELMNATWRSPQEVTEQYPTAVEEAGHFLFRVATLKMRIRVAFCFPHGIVIIGGLRNV